MPLILEDALLSAADGLVQSGSKIWFHFQKYPWDLASRNKILVLENIEDT